MHAAAVDAENRLGHERGVQSVTFRNRLDDQLERFDVVGGAEGFVVLEVDFVLTVGDFVVRGFDFKAHVFQGQADVASNVFAHVVCAEVEVPAFVGRLNGGNAVGVGLKEEELAFRADVESESHVLGFLENLFEDVSRVAFKRGLVRTVDVADESGDFVLLRTPREDNERIVVRAKIHVGFFDSDEPFD